MKKKLESRRLEFDSKLSKVNKSKKEKPEDEEALRIAQMRYEDSLTDVTNKMLSLHDSEEEQLGDLVTYIDAQLEYYQQCAELTRNFQEKVTPHYLNRIQVRNIPRSGASSRNQIRGYIPKRNSEENLRSRASTSDSRLSQPNRGNQSERASQSSVRYETSKRYTPADTAPTEEEPVVDSRLSYASQKGAMVFPSANSSRMPSG